MIEGESLTALMLGYGGSFAFGCLLGTAFLWGLWLTVRRLPTAAHPAFLMLASLILRFGLTLAGFLLIARLAGWEHLLIAAIGFTLPRLLMKHRLQTHPAGEDPGA
ncbi:F1F0 ATPase subunit 2 [Marinobacter pelagius]|uniref:F1F0 ATPase subunit 2 n=1 Tax=Marinobacter pelagius TaxID=379482 RepID=A0A366GSW9_9GAMM|nr:ATP synthase subunit I [Marinobacter pelagius]RBP31063.1 F1F0 ATPase subunit 2 [Marinobacter pelagius]